MIKTRHLLYRPDKNHQGIFPEVNGLAPWNSGSGQPAVVLLMRDNPHSGETTTKISAKGSMIMSMQAPAESGTGSSRDPAGEKNVLLSSLESARDLLARRLVREYHTVGDPDLNYLTVSSILQILFLRAGEECGFAEPGTLAALAASDGIPKRMARACSDAGLDPDRFFEKGPEGSRTLPVIPDTPLREIISSIDRPDFPAPVSRIPPGDCAAVLEYFLGMRVMAGEGSRVQRAPKSAMLYTGSVDIPARRVVDDIAQRIADMPRSRTAPGDDPAIRVLDPACGAGLFLLAAYRHLLRKKTRSPDRPAQPPDIPVDPAGLGICGTDIDPESVSAARFVLLLAFIEECTNAGAGILPAGRIRDACGGLATAIRCGNALIAPDYFRGKPVFPFNAAERRKVNAFDWEAAFPEITGRGGFDAVIGSPPPYRPFAVPAREEYFQTHYDTYAPSAGLYGYFIERGLALIRPGGSMTVLVPGTFLRSRAARPLRRLLLTRRIEAIVNTGTGRLLPEGDADVYLLSLRNEPPVQHGIMVQEMDRKGHARDHGGIGRTFTLDQRSLDDGGWVLQDTRTAAILEKIRAAGTPLGQYVMGEIAAGTVPVRNNPLVIDTAARNRLTKHAWWCRRFIRPLLRPADIRRNRPVKPERFVVRVPDKRSVRKCRALAQFLEEKVQEQQRQRDEPGSGELIPIADLSGNFPGPEENRPKIIFSEFQRDPAFFFDPEGSFAIASPLMVISRNDPFLAGILNSSLGWFVLTHTCPLTDRGYHTSPAAVGKFPVFVPDFDKLADKTRHDKLVSLLTHIHELNRYFPQARTDQERRLVEQEIDATDVRIDALVYGIYGLTPEEIAAIEEKTG